MKILFILAIVLSAVGCKSMPNEEIMWQALHAIDFAQTMSIASDPCYVESGAFTSRVIGEDPSKGEVVA